MKLVKIKEKASKNNIDVIDNQLRLITISGID